MAHWTVASLVSTSFTVGFGIGEAPCAEVRDVVQPV
jgi:hypothetical protein